MSDALAELKQRLGRLADLGYATSLAHWDQQTKMPPRGGEARAEVLGTLAEISHREFTDDETGRLLERARVQLDAEGRGADPDSDDVRLLTLVNSEWEKARRVPGELAAALARAASTGQEGWLAARAQSDYAAFVPHLRHNLELAREYVECHAGHGDYNCAYDVLLDDYEPAMRTATVRALFDELKGELLPMLEAIERAPAVDESPLHVTLDGDAQRRLAREVVGLMGFDDAGWRLDDTVHPFATRVGDGDVRLTSRFEESYWPMGLYGAMHECGHGLYEDGVSEAYRRNPLGSVRSLALHESQSRLWENMVGRGYAFCNVLAPRLRAADERGFSALDVDGLYRAVNRVKRSYIRVEADEATYALHIILRFELEQELIDGTLSAQDAGEAWRERYARYFNQSITDDADGILQDVHWAAGLLGYFPTYALGNLIAGQLWERAGEQLHDRDGALAAGDLHELREWLRARVHRFGGKYPTPELLEREVGGSISVAPFVRYLKAKLGHVYGIDL